MADFTLGSAAVISGDVNLCRIGAWTADLFLAVDDAPAVGTTATLTLRDRALLCTVTAASSDYLQTKVRVVAGRGKLDVPLSPRDYRGYQASEIAQDVLRDAGEVPGEWSALDTYCAHWTRVAAPCRVSVRRLVRLFGESDVVVSSAVAADVASLSTPVWRVMDDGTVDSVVDEFADAGVKFDGLGAWGQDRLLLLGVDSALISPGQSVTAWGQRRLLDRIVYSLSPDAFTCRCWYY